MSGRLPVALLSLALWSSCRFGPDLDKSRFACNRDSDCGSGDECAPRIQGGAGVCFPLGYCPAFDFSRDNAHCGDCATSCVPGTACTSSACRESNCSDGIDNDGNGLTDCQDSSCAGLSCSNADAGVNCGSMRAGLDGGTLDAGTPDAGTDGGIALIRACVPRETICDDGLDNDGDGATDCADDDCDGRTCAPGKICRNRACQ